GDEPTKVHTGLKLPDAAYAHGGEGADEVDIDSLLESTSTPTPSIGLVGSETHALENGPREEPIAEERISSVDARQRAVHLSLPGLPALVAPPFGRRPVGVRLPELAQDRISRPTPTPVPVPGIFGGPIGVKLPDLTQESGGEATSTTTASVPAQPVLKAADTERSNEPIVTPSTVGIEPETGSAGEAIDPAAVTQRAPVGYVSQPELVAAVATAASEPTQSAAEATPPQQEPSTSAPSVSEPSSIQAGAAEDQKHVLSDAPFIRELEPRRSSAAGRLGLWLGLAALCGGAFLLIRSPSRSPSASVAVHAATPLPAPAASESAQQMPSAGAAVPAPDTQNESSGTPQAAQTTEEERTATKKVAPQSPAPEKKPATRESKPSGAESVGAESALAQAKPATRAPVKASDQAKATTEEAPEEAEQEQATFDASEAASALDGAATEASSCRQASDPSGVAVVTITFAPSGRVTTATIAGPPFVGTATGSCIAATMRRAKVPPFTGKLVTVRKTVTIQ
ncbi:MAG TPA: hypothetical protein VKP30_10295, partial [Polyangiaceae bacterium]|nr:hypothetical protein [Polyangiaceae bacterium]